MGTSWSAKFVAPRSIDDRIAQGGVERRLAEVVEQMSTWEPGSALSRYNASAPGSWHGLPSAFATVLACALEVAELSDGAFDPTAGALVDAWGFGATNRHDEPAFAVPDEAALAAARTASGWQRVAFDRATRRLQQPGGVSLDFSAIAKGFAVDHVSRYLHELGFADTLVEVGGELRGDGIKPDGQPWWVALEQPPDLEPGDSAPDDLVALHDLSVATSGDYRRFYMAGGARRSHTIDPRTGRPIEHELASVTVLHRECMLADAWSTALGVMGPRAGLAYADTHGIAARFLSRAASESMSSSSIGSGEQLSAAMRALME